MPDEYGQLHSNCTHQLADIGRIAADDAVRRIGGRRTVLSEVHGHDSELVAQGRHLIAPVVMVAGPAVDEQQRWPATVTS
jgi:hypothetical protein